MTHAFTLDTRWACSCRYHYCRSWCVWFGDELKYRQWSACLKRVICFSVFDSKRYQADIKSKVKRIQKCFVILAIGEHKIWNVVLSYDIKEAISAERLRVCSYKYRYSKSQINDSAAPAKQQRSWIWSYSVYAAGDRSISLTLKICRQGNYVGQGVSVLAIVSIRPRFTWTG